MGAGLLHIQGRKVRVGDLVRSLTSILDRPVVDKTGFTGEFDLDLRFTRDETIVGFLGLLAPAGSPLPTDPNSANICAALEEQLGLKLVPAKAPVDVGNPQPGERKPILSLDDAKRFPLLLTFYRSANYDPV